MRPQVVLYSRLLFNKTATLVKCDVPMKLSVVMPIYNEPNTLPRIVSGVLGVPLDIELLCVDDGSKDGSREILAELEREHRQVRVLLQSRNMGTGSLRRFRADPRR